MGQHIIPTVGNTDITLHVDGTSARLRRDARPIATKENIRHGYNFAKYPNFGRGYDVLTECGQR